jgi:hypothetical protein
MVHHASKESCHILMGFRLSFAHISGVKNSLADSLSRCFEYMTDPEREIWIPKLDEKDDFLFTITPNDASCQQSLQVKRVDVNHTKRCCPTEIANPVVQNNSWSAYTVKFESSKTVDPNISAIKDVHIVPFTAHVPDNDATRVHIVSDNHYLFEPVSQPNDSRQLLLTPDSQNPAEVQLISGTPDGAARSSLLRPDAESFVPGAAWKHVFPASVDCDTSPTPPSGQSTAHHSVRTACDQQDSCTMSQPNDLCSDHTRALLGDQAVYATKQRKARSKQQPTTTAMTDSPQLADTTQPAIDPVSHAADESDDRLGDSLQIPMLTDEDFSLDISSSDYENGESLKNMFNFLNKGQLTGIDSEDRITLLLQHDFFIDQTNGLLYKIALPKSKKIARTSPTEVLLALPERYLSYVVEVVHNAGHFSAEKTYQFLRSKYYAKNLFRCVIEF